MRSICNKLPELYGLLSGKSYDIICITETWLNSIFSDNLITNNYPYTIHRHDRENRTGGGRAIMIKSALHSAQITLLQNIKLLDLRVTAVEVIINGRIIALCCIYNPPNCSAQCITSVYEIVHFLDNKYYHLCILGDFNLPELHDCLKSLCNIPVVIIPQVNALSTHALEQIVDETSRTGYYLALIFVHLFF